MNRFRNRRTLVAGGGVAAAVVGFVAIVAIASNLLLAPQPSPTGSSSTAPSATDSATVAVASPTAVESPSASASATPSASPTELFLPDVADLDGLTVAVDLAHRIPVAVMLDDNRRARPQSGMSGASIVYQAPVDGGEVRYMLIFQEGDAKDVGPVRSTRFYFARWASEYHSVLGHFGGDWKTIKLVIPPLVKQSVLWDMDALKGGGCPYHRISSRVAPFNAYTNTAALRACVVKKGYPQKVRYILHRSFSDDLPAAQRPTSGSITIPYHNQTIGYAYDPTSNSYLRSTDGKAEIDASNGQRITARDVVVLFQTLGTDPQPGHIRPVVGQIGTGKAVVFRDGMAIVGTWTKNNETDLTRFLDASGNEIPLARGHIFIQVVAVGTNLTYKAG